MTSRDVEDLVNCNMLRQTFRNDYQNDLAAEQLDVDRSVQHNALRRAVSAASLQIVLLSKSLLNHVAVNANDPLGQLLHPKRVIGLFLGVDELKDVTQLHESGFCSSLY